MSVTINKRFLDVIKEDEQLHFFEEFGQRKDIESLQLYLHSSDIGHVALKGKYYEPLALVKVSSSFVKGAVNKVLSLFDPISDKKQNIFQTYVFDDYSVMIHYMDSKTPYYMMSVKR